MKSAGSKPSFYRTFPAKPEKFTFIAYGDCYAKPGVHRNIAAQFDKYKPAFIIQTGDIVSDGDKYEGWKFFCFDVLKDVIDHIPFWPAHGNHDGDGPTTQPTLAAIFPALTC